jgi:hypothetical protein
LMMAQGFGADNLFDGGDGVGNLEDIAPAPVKKNGMRLGAVIPGYGYGYDTSGNYRYGYNMDPDPPKTAAQITKETMTAAAPAVKAVAQAAAQSASIASSIAGSIGGGGAMISMGGGISPRSSGGSSGGSGSGSDSSAGGGSEESNSFISYSSSNPFKKMMLFTNDLKKTNHRPNYNTMDRCNLNKQVDGFERFFSISQFKESGVALSTNLEIRSQKQKKTDLAQKSTTRMINGSISLSQMPTKEKKMIWGVMAGWNHFNAKLADQPIKAAADMGTFSIFNGLYAKRMGDISQCHWGKFGYFFHETGHQ